jgi:hypothetical protein
MKKIDFERIEKLDIEYICQEIKNNNPDLFEINIKNKSLNNENFKKIIFSLNENTIVKKLNFSGNLLDNDCIPDLIYLITNNKFIDTINIIDNSLVFDESLFDNVIDSLNSNFVLIDFEFFNNLNSFQSKKLDSFLDRNYDK